MQRSATLRRPYFFFVAGRNDRLEIPPSGVFSVEEAFQGLPEIAGELLYWSTSNALPQLSCSPFLTKPRLLMGKTRSKE